MLKTVVLLLFASFTNAGDIYDSYTYSIASPELIRKYEDAGVLSTCTIEVEPCDEAESRRVDGTCNNLNIPSAGGYYTPEIKLLPSHFGPNFSDRLSESGEPLPNPRHLRWNGLQSGRVTDTRFTQLVAYYMLGFFVDIGFSNDENQYVLNTTTCCTPEGKYEELCAPIKIRNDDPVHRFSDIRCLNLTKPLTFQHYGCTAKNTTPERIELQTTHIDLSNIYYKVLDSMSVLRLYEGGLLKYEVDDDGKIWPLSGDATAYGCLANVLPHETRCHQNMFNTLLGSSLISLWYYRQHNLFASKLAEINPHWDDEKLFITAMNINVGTHAQIMLKELLPLLMGEENMINDGIISDDQGFRNIYDESVQPQMSVEFIYMLRYFHTIQEANLKLYDKDGYHVKDFKIMNLTMRTGLLAIDDMISQITQGSFRQGGGAFDQVVDYDISEVGFGPILRATDITASDLYKSRLFGFQGYAKYREYCTGKKVKKFDDLADVIRPERLEQMKSLYKHVFDVDLMFGVWQETPVPGGFVPPTLYCIFAEQLSRTVVSDRHWYELPDRPDAFTEEQLAEIRKSSVARLLCNIGDSVTSIQHNAFVRISSTNPLMSCDDIPSINLELWKDDESY